MSSHAIPSSHLSLGQTIKSAFEFFTHIFLFFILFYLYRTIPLGSSPLHSFMESVRRWHCTISANWTNVYSQCAHTDSYIYLCILCVPFWASTALSHTHACIYFVKCSFIKFSNHYFVDGFSQHVWVCVVCISPLQRFNFSHTFHVVQCISTEWLALVSFGFVAFIPLHLYHPRHNFFCTHTPTHPHTCTPARCNMRSAISIAKVHIQWTQRRHETLCV